jgi:chemotaxis-related protein WspD
MSDEREGVAAAPRCWAQIGVWGDGSCPELLRVGHCRNCEVYTAGGRQLLDRSAPADYLDLWTDLVARDKDAESTAATPYVVFRVGASWLGLRAIALRELTQPSVIRSVPHPRSDLLLGLTAVRGEICLCMSLHMLIGETAPSAMGPGARFLVARHQSGDWVFPVDEVSSIENIVDAAIEPLPATLRHSGTIYTMGIVQCGDRPVGLIDEELVFSALERRIA